MKFLKITLITLLVFLVLSGTGAAVYFIYFRDNVAQATLAENGNILLEPSEPLINGGNYILTEIEEIFYENYFEENFSEENFSEEEPGEEPGCPYTVTILLSAAGDTTLGGDRRWQGYHAFMREFENAGEDYAHFLYNVAHIFYESDIALVNLEGTLTDITSPHMDKEFVFRGPPRFANILSAGNVNIVSIANNHTQDFFRRGYYDTQNALTDAGIIFFGNEFHRIVEINGIKVGFFGHRVWADYRENRTRVTDAIEYLRENGAQLIIAYNHWGEEGENFPQPYQSAIGRFTLQQGADLVLGAHPHVIQGIEEYGGRYIVHSLANFCFGGNAAPRDQDSFIFQQEFTFYRGVLQPDAQINIIPIRVSSVRGRNDFRPTPAEGDDAERILARIERYSEPLR